MTVQSKPVRIKDDKPKTIRQKITDWWEGTWLGWRLVILSERLRRSWAYARFGWSNYDFDAGYALALLSFKLKRVQDTLINRSGTVQDPKELQALRLVIRLLDRLVEDNYSYFYERHNQKWYGKPHPEIEFEKIEGFAGSRMISGFDRLPPDQQELAGDEIRVAFATDDAIKSRDKRWAFSILSQHYESWWD